MHGAEFRGRAELRASVLGSLSSEATLSSAVQSFETVHGAYQTLVAPRNRVERFVEFRGHDELCQ